MTTNIIINDRKIYGAFGFGVSLFWGDKTNRLLLNNSTKYYIRNEINIPSDYKSSK